MTDPTTESALSEGIARLWEKFKPTNLERVATLERAVAALLDGRLDPEDRRLAEREAHKLAGGVGTYGFARASQLARRCEELLEGTAEIAESAVLRLSDAVVQLRDELEKPPVRRNLTTGAAAVETVESNPSLRARPVLVLAALAEDFRERVVMEAEARGWDVHNAGGQVRRFANAVILIDLDEVPTAHHEEALHRLNLALPGVPIVALSEAADFQTRLFAARMGVHRFGRKPVSPQTAVEMIAAARNLHVGTLRKVLIVDDDVQVTAAAVHHLSRRGIETHCVHRSDAFWPTLESVRPDIVLFDADLPEVSGVDACRMMRADRDWRHLPILLLAGRTDTQSVTEAFDAGADDFIAKPLVGPELIARVENWIDRVRLSHAAGPFESATGLRRRQVALGEVRRLLAIAERHQSQVCFVWIELPQATPERLRDAGRKVESTLRDEDLLARWSDDELLVVFYETGEQVAIDRIGAALGRASEGMRIGAVTWPADGDNLDVLHAESMSRMEQEPAGVETSVASVARGPANRVDIAVIEDDEALAGLLLHALDVAGYSTHWIEDGQDAVDTLAGNRPAIRPRVILLDVDLPGRDGISVLRELVRSDVLETARVIVLTRRAGEPDVVRALELGASAYVEKPFSLPALLQHIRQAGARN